MSFVHILPQSASFKNAFFDPVDNSLNYGDGDGILFNFFSSALDVVAHEFTHGVTQFSSDLIFLNESGALNEAFSDIMSAAVEFFIQPVGNERLEADWVLGEDLFFSFGSVVRDMANPGASGLPDHYGKRCLPPSVPLNSTMEGCTSIPVSATTLFTCWWKGAPTALPTLP